MKLLGSIIFVLLFIALITVAFEAHVIFGSIILLVIIVCFINILDRWYDG